ncbi:putative secreted protein [Streptomyces gancidicus BKS 13-15]|uniref:Putative secreted protein n=1 Tax=Streptomyces gancidicus BKS 13-15 TaxID=1284664 RepID=M3DXR2_STREZ|nr:hypothetical protein [Streptomyces gancidicus]EMF25901.1 putative secreted protein [Streptomyces gancidicus BKS 13-15]
MDVNPRQTAPEGAGRAMERRGLLVGLGGLGLASGAAALLPGSAAAGEAGRYPGGAGGSVVRAVAAPGELTLSTDAVPAGLVTLRATTPDPEQQHPLGLLRLRHGVSVAGFLEHYRQAATAQDPAERRAALALIDTEAHYFGGPAVSAAGGAVEVSWILAPGTYHLLDYTTTDPAHPERVRTLTVTPAGRPHGGPRSAPHVIAPYDDGDRGRFLTAATLPADGVFHVVNHTRQLSEVMFLRVTPGASEEDVTACMEALGRGEQPPVYPFTGVPTGLTPLQPGASAVFAHALRPGRYLLTSFISSRETLVKRAFEGMWQLVTLR